MLPQPPLPFFISLGRRPNERGGARFGSVAVATTGCLHGDAPKERPKWCSHSVTVSGFLDTQPFLNQPIEFINKGPKTLECSLNWLRSGHVDPRVSQQIQRIL
jgi:hypothetical protein